MNVTTTRKTFSLPTYITARLDEVAGFTGQTQSSIVLQALSAFIHRFEDEDSVENWMEVRGRGYGEFDSTGAGEVCQ